MGPICLHNADSRPGLTKAGFIGLFALYSKQLWDRLTLRIRLQAFKHADEFWK
jgi:hypothetical protein